MAFRAGVVHILKDFCFAVIAAFLLPDIEPDPAIIAKARRSNVHTPMIHGQPDGPTGGDRCQQGLQALNIGATGPRRRSLWATPPGAGFAVHYHIKLALTPASRTQLRPHPWRPRRPDQSPRDRRLKSHFHIPTGVPQLEPDRFHPYPRACPTPRVSAPRQAHADTPTPRI